jgi:predicted kinase/predicted HD phosphohydrolase
LKSYLYLSYKQMRDILNEPSVNVLVWIPGAGKSTLINKNIKPWDIVISSDEIRMELFWNYQEQSQNGLVFEKYFQKLEHYLKLAASWQFSWKIFLDATSANKKDRQRIIHTANKYWIQCDWVFLNIHPELSIKRDSFRKGIKEVGDAVVYRMFNKLEVPSTDEWFNNVTTIDIKDDITEDKMDRVAYWVKELTKATESSEKMSVITELILPNLYEYTNAIELEQKSEYHDETVWTHILQVVTNAVEKWYSNNVIVATIFHDAGKLYARRWNPEFERFTFDGHGDVSVKVLDLFYTNRLKKIEGIDFTQIRSIVKFHNYFDRLWRKLDKIIDENNWINWGKFDEKEFLKSDIVNFIKKEWFDNSFINELFNHWICDKEGAKRNIEQLNNYKNFKTKLEWAIDNLPTIDNNNKWININISSNKEYTWTSLKEALDKKRADKKQTLR